MAPSWISEWDDFSNSNSPCGPNASHQVWAQSDLGFGSRCSFKMFKIAAQGAILDSRKEWFKQFWISISHRCLQSSFGSIRLAVWKEMSFEEFQDGRHGGHLGHQNRTILASLNLYAPMPPIKFRLNLTYGLGGDVVWRISRWSSCLPSWISEWNDFSNSESLCYCDASYQVSAQPDLWFEGDVVWRISKWPPCGPSWTSEQNNFSNSEFPCCHNASH